jgi:hypothetical protein
MANSKTCKKKFCKKIVEREKKSVNEFLGAVKKSKNKTMKKGLLKKVEQDCVKKFCNPGCKGTIYEKGDGNKLPAGMRGLTKKKGDLERIRKMIFKGKKDVLKNSFYKELPESKVKKAKREGALSGCGGREYL